MNMYTETKGPLREALGEGTIGDLPLIIRSPSWFVESGNSVLSNAFGMNRKKIEFQLRKITHLMNENDLISDELKKRGKGDERI